MNITLTKKPCGKFDITTDGELSFTHVYSHDIYVVFDGSDVCQIVFDNGYWWHYAHEAVMLSASDLREIADLIDALNDYEEN